MKRNNTKHKLYIPYLKNGYNYINIVVSGKVIRIQNSRYIMEQSLRRKLFSTEIVHHNNHIKVDDSRRNLKLHTSATHISTHRKGTHLSLATKLAISKARKGVPMHENTRVAIFKAHKGTHISNKHKLAISESKKLFWKITGGQIDENSSRY